MEKPVAYRLPATKLIPNSPLPLLHYKGFFSQESKNLDAVSVYDTFKSNGWDVQWIARYGRSQNSHYHAETHEAMAVLTGPGTIRFGVADTDEDPQKNTYEDAYEDGGVEVQVNRGDVLVIPAGVAHKSFDPTPGAEFAVLTANDSSDVHGAHGVDSPDVREALKDVRLSGFTMIGAYPKGCDWSWSEGGAHEGKYEQVWNVAKPPSDPLLGSTDGIHTYWN